MNHLNHHFCPLFVCIGLLLPMVTDSTSASATFYVSVHGSDAGPGTVDKPFQTLQKCATVVSATNTSTDGVCMVMPGTYRESVSLNVSDTAISFIAQVPGSVIVSGLDIVDELQWKFSGLHPCIYKAELPKWMDVNTEQLFYQGSMMIEARWPNLNIGNLENEVMNRDSWEPTQEGSVYGKIVDPVLQDFNFSWNGALATLQVAHQFFTWTRIVSNHSVGEASFQYPKDLPDLAEWSQPGNHNWGKNQYFLSGKLGALDAPGEWFIEKTDTIPVLYFYPPHKEDGSCSPIPGSKDVEVKNRKLAFELNGPAVELCNISTGATVNLENIDVIGATFSMRCCTRCTISNVSVDYPILERRIPEMESPPGPSSVKTSLYGFNSTLVNVSIRMSNKNGLDVAGQGNSIINCLIDRTDWLGTLSYIPVGVTGTHSKLINSTVRYFGNAGVVTAIPNTPPAPPNGTQLPPEPMTNRHLEVAYNHIHHGGLIGMDSAALYTGGWGSAGLEWHHNWVHDASEKCVRGDDQSRNMTVHHNVIFNCGQEPFVDRQSTTSGFGLVLKGNGHIVFANSIFLANASELCLPSCIERLKPFRDQFPRHIQNSRTQIFNSVADVVVGACGCNKTEQPGGNRTAIFHGELQELKLRDPLNFDFRPGPGSPLLDAGIVFPPYTNGYHGSAPDIGAYEAESAWWRTGCRGLRGC